MTERLNIPSIMSTVAHRALLGPMTGAERAAGRFLRAPDEHPAAAPAAEAPAAEENALAMPEVEVKAAEVPKEITAEDLEREFGGDPAPAEPKAEEPKAEPDGTKPKEEESAKPVEKSPAVLEAEARANEAQRQADYWREQANKGAAPKEEAKPAVDPNAEPKAEDYEFGEADIKYITDLAKFSARQEFQQQHAESEQRAEFARLDANYQTNIAKATERLPDFDEKVTQSAKAGKWPCPPLIALGIRDSEVGPDIAYHLASNVPEAERIAALDPYLQARELGRLEARFMSEATARTEAAKAPAPAKVSQAPTPPANLVRGAGGKFTVNADTDDFAAFDKAADKILAK